MIKLNRKVVTGFSLIGFAACAVLFQNCSKSDGGGGETTEMKSVTANKFEENLDILLTEASELSAGLRLNENQIKTMNKLPNLPSTASLSSEPFATEILQVRGRVYDMIEKEKLASNSNDVLRSVDYLVNALARARTQKSYQASFMDNLLLHSKLTTDLQNVRTELVTAMGAFKEQVDQRFARVDERFTAVEASHNQLATSFNAFKKLTDERFTEVKSSIQTLSDSVTNELTALKAMQVSLKASLTELKAAQATSDQALLNVSNLQARMCSVNSAGVVEDSRARCSGTPTDLATGNCCLTVEAVDCNVLFPTTSATAAARNQCTIMIAILKNHDDQLRAIRVLDSSQNSAIDKIRMALENLSEQQGLQNRAISSLNEKDRNIVELIDILKRQVDANPNNNVDLGEIVRRLAGVEAGVAEASKRWYLPTKGNTCDDDVTRLHFVSTCDGSKVAEGGTCVWYDECTRFDAGSGRATGNMIAAGFTVIDMPGGRQPASACSGGSDEDGYACKQHVEQAEFR